MKSDLISLKTRFTRLLLKKYVLGENDVSYINETWSMDIYSIWMTIAEKGYRFISVDMDSFSKFAWTILLKHEFFLDNKCFFSWNSHLHRKKPEFNWEWWWKRFRKHFLIFWKRILINDVVTIHQKEQFMLKSLKETKLCWRNLLLQK